MGRIASKPNADLSLAPIGRSIRDFVSLPYGDYCEFSNGGIADISIQFIYASKFLKADIIAWANVMVFRVASCFVLNTNGQK